MEEEGREESKGEGRESFLSFLCPSSAASGLRETFFFFFENMDPIHTASWILFHGSKVYLV